MTEDQLQAKCFQDAHNRYPDIRGLLWAVPNGGKRNLFEAQKLKATGVIAGVHDLHLFWKGKFYTFELKVDNNRQSDKQKQWGAKITAHGGICHEIRALEQFQEIICNIVTNG